MAQAPRPVERDYEYVRGLILSCVFQFLDFDR
jgi:hypothetical protein